MFGKAKDKAQLIVLDKGLKSVEIFKDDVKKLFAYKNILETINSTMLSGMEFTRNLTDKKRKKIKAQVEMINKIKASVNKNEKLLKSNEETSELLSKFKTMSEEYLENFNQK